MRTEQLQYFIEVVKTGSLRTAAENLYMTQPALGAAITSLEKELGYPLFNRSHTGMTLTEHGLLTLEIATEILEKTKRLEFIRYIYQHTDVSDLRGQLHISTIITISMELLQDVLPAFGKAYPNVELIIIERNSGPALNDVLMDKSDLALVCLQEDMRSAIPEDFACEQLWEEKIYAVVRASSELAKKKALSVRQLSQYPLAIMGFDHDDDTVRESVFDNYPDVKIALRSTNYELTQRHILSTGSVGLAFIGTVKDPQKTFLEGISVVPISDKINLCFCVLYRKDSSKIQLIQAFVETLKEVYK